jgi:hypothetical protein
MFYATLIAEAIGTDNPATLSVVEELMRTDRTALDGLSRAQFIAEARAAFADMQMLAAAGALDEYRDALGL